MRISQDNKLKATILLAEYNTLRAEATARAAMRYNLTAIGVAALSFLAGAFLLWIDKSRGQNDTIYWGSVSVLIAVFVVGIWTICGLSRTNWRDLEKAVSRVREIELQINELAQEDLLVWENLYGGSMAGYRGASRPLPRSTLSGRRPPPRTFTGSPLQETSAPS